MQRWLMHGGVACRECADIERALANDPGVMARKMTPLVFLLSSRTLDIERGFGKQNSITYPQLVGAVYLFQRSSQVHCSVAAWQGARARKQRAPLHQQNHTWQPPGPSGATVCVCSQA